MPPTYFSPGGSLSPPLEPIPQHDLRPPTRFFTPRSTPSSTESSLSPGLVAGLVAIGILAFISAAGAGLALHIHYCRQSDCSVCCVLVRFKPWRGPSVQAHDRNSSRVQPQQSEYSQTPRDRANLLSPPTHDGFIPSLTPLSPLAPPPTVHIRGPHSPEMSNSAISVRGSITSSVDSDDYASTLRASQLMPACPLHSPTSLAPFGRTLDSSLSTITLPSFVEQEYLNTTPSPMLATPTRFSFQPPRSHSMVTNSGYDLPSPSIFVSDRPLPPQWAGVRPESTPATFKSVARPEIVGAGQPGTLETTEQSGITSFRRDALLPLTIPAHTPSFLSGHHSFPSYNRYPLSDTGVVSNVSPWQLSLESPQGCTPLALYPNDLTQPSSSCQSPVLGFSSSPSSYASPDEKPSRVTSQATFSMSPVPSISAFPSPPDFTPGPRDRGLSIYSTYCQPFPIATLRENASVGGAETTSPSNKGQTSTPFPAADTPRLMTTVNPYPVLFGHLHSDLMARDNASVMSDVFSRVSSMKRLSRVPLGPRQMHGGPKLPLWWTSHPPSE